jgi:hypothetical protein
MRQTRSQTRYDDSDEIDMLCAGNPWPRVSMGRYARFEVIRNSRTVGECRANMPEWSDWTGTIKRNIKAGHIRVRTASLT